MSCKKTYLLDGQKNANIGDLAGSLAHKYGPQNVMGQPSEDIFHHTSIDADKGGHSVPVENFLNAQCLLPILISKRHH